MALFRHEVLAEQRTQWLGTVMLAPRRVYRAFALFAAAAIGALLLLLVAAQYTRTARVNGWLVPSEGLVRVLAPRAGVVTRLHVEEGRAVRRGEPLVTLSDELQSAALGATQAQVVRSLAERRASLAEERSRQEQLLAQQRGALERRIQALGAEETKIAEELELLGSRVRIAARQEALQEELRQKGFISEQRVQQAVAERLEQQARARSLERTRLGLARERLGLEGELRDLPLKAEKEIGALERTIAQLEQERAEIEARREIIVPAPQDGVVSAILAVPGSQAAAGVPLLSVVPARAALEAQLYSPSRAIGFVRSGQPVLLRYQAYPYQKFGHYKGTVATVSRSPVAPAELPAQIAPASLGAASAAAAAGEPLYRIDVTLESQAVLAYGERKALQPGMLLEADIALDRRRLYEWMLDPLYTLSGKWR